MHEFKLRLPALSSAGFQYVLFEACSGLAAPCVSDRILPLVQVMARYLCIDHVHVKFVHALGKEVPSPLHVN